VSEATVRNLLLLSFLASLAALAGVACGDDPGASDLPYAYPIDATPDGLIPTEVDASNE
jgi:hypothetical protein